MSDLYQNEESDYCGENTSDDEDFRSTILQPFQFQPEQKSVVMRALRKKLNILTLLAADLINITIAADAIHIRVGNLD